MEKIWADGETLRALDVNSVLAKQVIITSTSGALGTAWLGKHVYCSDTDLLLRYNGASWVSYPQGLVDHASSVGTGDPGFAIGGTRTIVNSSTLGCNAVAGERYRYTMSIVLLANAAGSIWSFNAQKKYGTGSWIDMDRQRDVHVPVASINVPVHISLMDSPPTGAVQYRIQVNLGAGSGGGEIADNTDATLEHIGSG